MATSPFITYLEFVGVVNDEVEPPRYMNHVDVVEVLNQNWEPYVPPTSVVTVETASKLLQESDDVLVGTPATWTGGINATYEYAWSLKGENQQAPVYITAWAAYDNTATPTPDFTATEVGQYQFVSRAKSEDETTYVHSASPKVYVSTLS